MMAFLSVALADIRDRVRRFSFLAAASIAVFLGYQVIIGRLTLMLGPYWGIYNAAWIGTLMSLTFSIMVSLFGFYLIRSTIERDRILGMGELIASSPLISTAYLAGKFLSNLCILLILMGVLICSAVAMLLIHGEDRALRINDLVLPFLLYSVPVVMFTSATAVVFGCIGKLRGTAGNIIYFILWTVILAAVGARFFGFDDAEHYMGQSLLAQGHTYGGGIILGIRDEAALKTFLWSGFDWRAVIGERLIFSAAALAVTAAAVPLFDRFDQAPRVKRRSVGLKTDQLDTRLVSVMRKHPIVSSITNFGMHSMVLTELRLLVKGHSRIWYMIMLVFWFAQFFASIQALRSWILPVTWLLCIAALSDLGSRDHLSGTIELVSSTPSPLLHKQVSSWSAGMLLACIAGLGSMIRFIPHPHLLPGFLAGMIFIPSLALLMGTVTMTRRAFQLAMLILWYLGPLNGLAIFDLTGSTAISVESGVPLYYIAVSPLLILLSLTVKQFQVHCEMLR